MMIVTFVSQCEKKALPRTRRVLNAFANRIGDNTWQTVITEDGLAAIKNLLRKTASKNTAVACHRIATRRRSELVWIVGNRRKFNEEGIVPVNYTTKELFMDLPLETKMILANTHGQPLSQHLFAVGYLAYQIIENLKINNQNLAQSAFIAGILHDIGKLDPQFQQWLNKKSDKSEDNIILPEDGVHIDTSIRGFKDFSFEEHPRHNEISWLLAESLLTNNVQLNSSQLNQIFHGIYWHHTRPYRKDDKFFNKAEGLDKKIRNSLNISCECMYTDLTSAENWLQRLGRLDRFDTNQAINIYTTVLPKSAESGKQSSNKAKFLASMNVWQSTIAWLGFVKNYLHDKNTKVVKINELYQVYQAFYADPACQRKIAEDLQKSLSDSVKLINHKVLDPISMPSRSKKDKNGVAKIASVSLRGDNRFVQMAICEVDENLQPNFVNEYAYPEDTDHSKVTIGMILPKN